MAVHRIFDFVNALLALACIGIVLPDTTAGRIAESIGFVVVLYPVLEPVFPKGRYWQLFAPGMVITTTLFQLSQVQMPAAVTFAILAAIAIGIGVTRRQIAK